MQKARQVKEEADAKAEKSKKQTGSNLDDVSPIVELDSLALDLGYALVPLVDREKGAELLEPLTEEVMYSDGTKEEVSTQLKSKGFRYNSYKECYTGEFNGKTVDVFVVTNHDLVYRICVVYPQQSDREIISEYNVLLSQFNRNKKYFAISKNSPISSEEHIAYEMSANNKEYSAGYAYISPELFSEEEVDQLHELLSQAPEMSQEEISSMVQSMMGSWVDNESQLSAEDALVILQKFSSILYGRVWFTIVEGLAQYNIVIYYDNAKNQPNGEDL